MGVPRKTLLVRLSKVAHHTVNPIAWKLYPKHNMANRPWIWKLNDWVAGPSVDWYIYKTSGKTREEWEAESKK